jgi:NAD-dependent dihydropyrimidine dehydrogenase PreA subunit
VTFVVNGSCIRCKTIDCVSVCPVVCLYEGENMLVIHPAECIDWSVSEPECPIDAIKADTEPGLEKWLPRTRKSGQILRRPTDRNRVTNMMCLAPYAFALVLVACVKVRKAK